MVIYTLWNLWKERNRRIFQNIQESAWQVAFRVKEDIAQKKRALTVIWVENRFVFMLCT